MARRKYWAATLTICVAASWACATAERLVLPTSGDVTAEIQTASPSLSMRH